MAFLPPPDRRPCCPCCSAAIYVAVMKPRAIALVALAIGGLLTGCGSTTTRTRTVTAPPVSVRITSPTRARQVSGTIVKVSGTVAPAGAVVQVAGRSATVQAGRFTANARAPRHGTTTIDVIATAPNRSPGATSIVIHYPRASQQTATADAGSPAQTPGPSVGIGTPPTGGQACGRGVSVGAHTSCAFAFNVQAAYQGQGVGTYGVYSPTTGEKYTMTCVVHGSRAVCTGGSGATVYLP